MNKDRKENCDMNELAMTFTFSDSRVHTVTKGEEIWFMLKDVCVMR